MVLERKFNADSGRNETVLWMILGPALLVLVFLYGFSLILLAPFCIIYSLLSLMLFIRTKNSGYMIKSMMFVFLSLFFILIPFTGFDILTMFLGGISLLFMIWLFILIAIRDYKWRTDEVLELAAMPVSDVKEGYTMRPMPAGKLDYQWNELLQFSKFIRRNLISVPHKGDDKIIFSLNKSRFKLISFNSDYIQDSWVSFDRKGQIAVHISRDDYQMYKENYAFDQLCNSLGNIYGEFFKLFQQNKESEIIKRIDLIRI